MAVSATKKAILILIATSFSTHVVRGQQCSLGWAEGFEWPGLDGPVFTMMNWDADGEGPVEELLIVGGDFLVAGDVSTYNIAAWNGTTWLPMGGGVSGQVGEVHCMTLYDGRLIVGGEFMYAGGSPANRIASWNGTAWRKLGTGMDSRVLSLAVYNGDLIASGFFSTAGDVDANHIARWDGESWQPLGDGLDEAANSMTVYEGDLIAGGGFSMAGGQPAPSHLARWDGFSWTPFGDTAINSILAVDVYGDDLVIGGSFTTIDGVPFNRIARWNGMTWQPFETGISGGFSTRIRDLKVDGDTLLAAGSFAQAGGIQTPSVARWSGAWEGFAAPGQGGGGINAVAAFQGSIYVAGETGPGFEVGHISRWSGRLWEPNGPLEIDDIVRSIGSFRGNLVVSGDFSQIGGTPANRIAILDGSGWHALGDGLENYADEMVSYQGDLIVRGDFLRSWDGPGDSLVKWDGTEWQNVDGWSADYYADAMIEFDGLLVVARSSISSGQTAVLTWDGTSWQQFGDLIAKVKNFVVKNNMLYAAIFEDVLQWNGSSWEHVLTLPSGTVQTVSVFDDSFIAAGTIFPPLRYVVKWDGNAWVNVGNGFWTFGGARIDFIKVFNGELHVGGRFDEAGTVSTRGVARLEGASWWPLQQGLYDGNNIVYVTSLATHRDRLVVGGEFLVAGNQGSMNLAQWGRTGLAMDSDGNNHVSSTDHSTFSNCLTNPVRGTDFRNTTKACLCAFGTDGDGDIDLSDWAIFQNVFSQ